MTGDEQHNEDEPTAQSEQTEQTGPHSETPDPAGPPVPVSREQGCSLTATVLSMLAVGVGIALIMPAMTGATRGATRSTKLQWEQRQAEIEEAFARQQAYQDAADE